MQNVRLEVERVYIVHVKGVHMPEMSLQIRSSRRPWKKKPVSNLMLSLIVALGFYLGVSVVAFQDRGYLTLLGMETLLSLTVWLFIYYILEELRRK